MVVRHDYLFNRCCARQRVVPPIKPLCIKYSVGQLVQGNNMLKEKVLIIGGGLAGCEAAFKLADNGFI